MKFEFRERKATKPGKGGVTGAKIIDGNDNSDNFQVVGDLAGQRNIAHDLVFADFQNKPRPIPGLRTMLRDKGLDGQS